MVPAYVVPGWMSLGTLIRHIAGRGEPEIATAESYAVYAPDELELDFTAATQVYVSGPVEVTDDLDEIYPEDVQREGLWVFCLRGLIEDVVDLAMEQKPGASDDEVVEALRHYMDNDDFLDLA